MLKQASCLFLHIEHVTEVTYTTRLCTFRHKKAATIFVQQINSVNLRTKSIRSVNKKGRLTAKDKGMPLCISQGGGRVAEWRGGGGAPTGRWLMNAEGALRLANSPLSISSPTLPLQVKPIFQR